MGELFKGYLITLCHNFENSERVKTSTALARELDFRGLEGLDSVYFCSFLGVGFGMAPGMDF